MDTLLFIDDDPSLLDSCKLYFEKHGFRVLCASDGEKGLALACTACISCVIVDIDMPNLNGFELCRRLRCQSEVPIIFLSGLTEEKNRVASFLAGGDDYLSKPYSIYELKLRILARIRNAQPKSPQRLIYGKLVIDMGAHTVCYDGRFAELSALQFEVLAFLAQNPGQVFSYQQIYDRVWKAPIVGSRHNLQVTVSTVRQKLAELCDSNHYIRTISRRGYYFSTEQESEECEP